MRTSTEIVRQVKNDYPTPTEPADQGQPWATPEPAYCVAGAFLMALDEQEPADAPGETRYPSPEGLAKGIMQCVAMEKGLHPDALLDEWPHVFDGAQMVTTHGDLGDNAAAWLALENAIDAAMDPVPVAILLRDGTRVPLEDYDSAWVSEEYVVRRVE